MKERFKNERELEQLYRQVMAYDRAGDVYNAIKLCKRLAKLSPDWSAPYAYLGRVYKQRKEWKPAFHYSLKAVEHNPFEDDMWSHLALAATMLEEWTWARQAWNHLGYNFSKSDKELWFDLGKVAVCLNPDTQPEIVEATRIDPARVVIDSIPQPSSGKHYKDLLLIDVKPAGLHHIGHHRIPYYNELEHLRYSPWRSFAVLLHTNKQEDVEILATLCQEAQLGFDNWSHAVRFLKPNLHQRIAEYFDHSLFERTGREVFLIAMAARRQQQVERVLEEWAIITLKRWSDLEALDQTAS